MIGVINRAYALERAILTHGKAAEVLRETEGPYGSPGGLQHVCTMRGLYHTSHNYLLIDTQDGGKLPQRNEPMFLLLYTEAIKPEDNIKIDNKIYKVTGIEDPGGLHLCTDLSLEVM